MIKSEYQFTCFLCPNGFSILIQLAYLILGYHFGHQLDSFFLGSIYGVLSLVDVINAGFSSSTLESQLELLVEFFVSPH
jgi:hypothetical protein